MSASPLFFSTVRSRITRSSKGRVSYSTSLHNPNLNFPQLLDSTSPALSGALLDDQLRALGLYAANTVGDGNCLFRALSDQLYGTPSRHFELRGQICDWIGRHRERYEPFVEDDRGLETHLKCMREHGQSICSSLPIDLADRARQALMADTWSSLPLPISPKGT